MLKSNLIRIIVLLLLIATIIVYFTIGFGWICQLLIVVMFILSLSYPRFKAKDDKKI
ncbi:Uncharacterised protein [Staphylococcus chromogenes]|nr:hypothetical protein GCM10008139_01920 [Staphylococcus chromogenes]SUM13869.1 Uncharacterised protein [Staphylococcus chromogenes]